MNLDKLVFFNVAWMEHYDGVMNSDKPVGGGSYIDENGGGDEIFNFHHCGDGCVYGFVEPMYKKEKQNTIHIERLGASKSDDHVDDVTVVWTAKRFQGGTYIVGWYLHATVFRRTSRDSSLGREHQGKSLTYNVKAKNEDAILLSGGERTLSVPRGKGYFGRSNIWFADSPESQDFVITVKEYIRKEMKARVHADSKVATLCPPGGA
jgi:5-methylcytosine-specific restriction protein A